MGDFSPARFFVVWLLSVTFYIAIAPEFLLFGVSSEIPMGIAIAIGLVTGPELGAFVGLLIGCTIDVFVLSPFGLGGLIYGGLGWACGHVFSARIERTPLIATLAMAIATTGGVFSFLLLATVFGDLAMLRFGLFKAALVAGVINGLFAFVLLGIANWVVIDDAPTSLGASSAGSSRWQSQGLGEKTRLRDVVGRRRYRNSRGVW